MGDRRMWVPLCFPPLLFPEVGVPFVCFFVYRCPRGSIIRHEKAGYRRLLIGASRLKAKKGTKNRGAIQSKLSGLLNTCSLYWVVWRGKRIAHHQVQSIWCYNDDRFVMGRQSDLQIEVC